MSTNKLPTIIDFIIARYKAPNQTLVGFRIYFWVVIVISGLFCTLFTYFADLDFTANLDYRGVAMSLIGYSLVLLFSSAVEFLFIKYKDDEAKFAHLDGDIKMFGFGTVIIGIILSTITYILNNSIISFVISILLVLGVWFMWWIANSKSLSIIQDVNEMKDLFGDNEQIKGSIPADYEF